MLRNLLGWTIGVGFFFTSSYMVCLQLPKKKKKKKNFFIIKPEVHASLLASMNTNINFWLQSISNKKWTKFMHGSGPRGAVGSMAI